MRSSVLVDPAERDFQYPWYWGRLSCEADQKRVDPLPSGGQSRGGSHWGRSVQTVPTVPRKERWVVGRSQGPQPPTGGSNGARVVHGIWPPALPAEVVVGGWWHRGRRGQCLGQAIFLSHAVEAFLCENTVLAPIGTGLHVFCSPYFWGQTVRPSPILNSLPSSRDIYPPKDRLYRPRSLKRLSLLNTCTLSFSDSSHCNLHLYTIFFCETILYTQKAKK